MQICKLPIMQKNIMSSATNATRFLVLGHNRCERTGADNTLMTICIDHKPGAMAGALGVLAKHSNNVCAVESYPDRCVICADNACGFRLKAVERVPCIYWCRDSPRRCFVWIEVEGHIKDPALIASVAELRHFTTSVHILGSFPRHSARQHVKTR
jgi:chorismate mutase/prephenate dehydratase